MNSIVEKLSEIETSAVSIVNHAESEKERLDADMARRRREFDESLKADTASRLARIREDLESKMTYELQKQKQTSDNIIQAYEQEYEQNHEIYARDILAKMIEVT